MKKVLSIVLTVAMIASLFAVGASAAPVANYETVEIPLFSQDYQDASKTEWTASYGNGSYSRGFAEKVLETDEEGETNYVIDFTANPEKNTMILTGPQTSIERDDFVIEFDARGVNTNATLDVVVKNPYHNEKAPTGWLVKLHSGAFGTEGKWYSFKVVADLSGVTGAVANNDSANFKAYRKERGGSEWSELTHVTANLNAGYPSYRMLMGSNAASNGESTSWTVSFQCPSAYTEGTFADTNYQLDNIKVYYEQEQLASVTDGVIAEQDYEDVANNTSATTATNGIGKATVMTEDGNSFLKLESVVGASFAEGYTELVSTSDFTRFDWTYEMDVCRVSGENAIGLNLYDVNGSPINLMIPSAELTEGVWYRYKISNLPIPNAAGTTIYMGPIIMKKDITNNGEWEIGKAYILTNPSSGTGRVVIQISSAPTNRARVTANGKNINPNDSDTSSEKNEAAVFYLDNLRFTRDEAIKVTNVAATETTASATIAFSNSAKSLTTDTYNVMMVSYDGEGRAVDVALETATPSAGAVEGVELNVDKTKDVRVYVWETSTGTPLLGNVLDISSFL